MGLLNGNIRSQSDEVNENFLKYGSEMLDQQMSLFRGHWVFCGTSRKMSSQSLNPKNPLNEGSCQLSVPFMGFVSPVVLEAKIMQQLWKLHSAWVDPVLECELAGWERWKPELSALTQVQIPRCHFQLHGDVEEISLRQ